MLDEKSNNSEVENLSNENVAENENVLKKEVVINETSNKQDAESAVEPNNEEDITSKVVDDKEGEKEEELKEEVISEKDLKSEDNDSVTVEKVETAEKPLVSQIDNEIEEVKKKKTNYEKLDLEGLVSELQKLVKTGSITEIKSDVDSIKKNFNKKFGQLLAEKKEAFIAEGGNAIDFYYSPAVKSNYNDLLFEYKTKREAYYENIAKEQKENLAKRLELIEELKELIENADPSTMYGLFKNLRERWRSIGKIPSAQYNDTWRTYEHHVERFYDLLHLSNDLRDLDFKHNLEEKTKLAERAEELVEMSDLNAAFKELQVLHRLWKEEVGPVAREHREEIWERFSNATKKIHERRHEHQKELESKYEENVEKKKEVIEKIRNLIDNASSSSHKYWQQKIKELEALRQQFFKIGKVPKSQNDKIWNAFKEATRNFNRQKNSYYKNVKIEQHNNLKKKKALVEKAESLKDSEDFDTTTDIMKQIQAEWKTIGHVPRKYSDKIWKQFKDACNYYFDRLHGKQDEANKEQIEAFNKKKELLENLKSQTDKNESLSLEVINSYIEDWNKQETLPHNMQHVEAKFQKVINSLYGKLDMDEKEIAMLKFKNMVDNYVETNNYRKLDNEQLFVRKKIDEITREIQQLENNMGFFANTDSDNPLLKGVQNNIKNYNDQLELWKTKLEYITSLDY
ncbi:DUF349 domain-containing protein [Aureibaculum marinum]|uniref:DUF349 domain-containing protein n=1 Tax=Aureibaculum marinum TaxID=2487930 RepID=A0A3N4NPB2_9FLAO|nr:DUF349 domain-containing protein [Aureibaculum marinum]RPD98202.1 DUF349 domain-containing protein [Aureibaculum marinum]